MIVFIIYLFSRAKFNTLATGNFSETRSIAVVSLMMWSLPGLKEVIRYSHKRKKEIETFSIQITSVLTSFTFNSTRLSFNQFILRKRSSHSIHMRTLGSYWTIANIAKTSSTSKSILKHLQFPSRLQSALKSITLCYHVQAHLNTASPLSSKRLTWADTSRSWGHPTGMENSRTLNSRTLQGVMQRRSIHWE